MERLTKIRKNGVFRYVSAIGSGRGCWSQIIQKLAAYEDTGLEPEEVKDMAENAETMLLTWFESRYGFPVGELMRMCEAKQEERLVVLPCKVGAKVYMIEVDEDGAWVGVKEVPFTRMMVSSFGKTVFLAREEAEAALRG